LGDREDRVREVVVVAYHHDLAEIIGNARAVAAGRVWYGASDRMISGVYVMIGRDGYGCRPRKRVAAVVHLHWLGPRDALVGRIAHQDVPAIARSVVAIPDHVQVVVAGIGSDEGLVVAEDARGLIDEVLADETPGSRIDLIDADAGESARARQVHPEQS